MKQITALALMFLAALPAVAAPANQHRTTDRLRGISSQRRQQIYYEIGLAENRAQRQANAAYPTAVTNPYSTAAQEDHAQNNVEPNTKMFNRLADKYHQVIQRRYHITDDQVSAIVVEGFDQHWASPPPIKD